jgi:hypothetical protein
VDVLLRQLDLQGIGGVCTQEHSSGDDDKAQCFWKSDYSYFLVSGLLAVLLGLVFRYAHRIFGR